jgi:hypothetical protein
MINRHRYLHMIKRLIDNVMHFYICKCKLIVGKKACIRDRMHFSF